MHFHSMHAHMGNDFDRLEDACLQMVYAPYIISIDASCEKSKERSIMEQSGKHN